ncbi:MAG: hypothetical protein HC814_03360 [Rhodobacteraceae bacterium]|nr:hypothetical protein [Paracoccaceae bacterium]
MTSYVGSKIPLNAARHGVKFIVSDDHAGLPLQRCQVRLIRNAMAFVPRQSQRRDVARQLRAAFNAGDRSEADRRLKQMAEQYRADAPKLAAWLEANVPKR